MNKTSITRLASLLAQVFVYIYAFNWFSFITADPDLWGHIRFGREIWSTGALPRADLFSYTAFGQPWINHEWLAEVIFFLIYHLWGSTGLLLFKLGIGLLIIRLLFQLYLNQENSPWIFAFYSLFLIPVLAPGFMVRPHLFTLLGMTLLWVILNNFINGNNRVILWAPLLFLFWVNCHGGVVAGIGIFGLVTGVEFIRNVRSHNKRGNILLKYFLLSTLALLIHPQGYHLWEFLYQTLSLPRAIGEWDPVPLWSTHYWQFKLLAVFFLLGLITRRKKRLWEIIVILLAVVYGFKHQRHTVLAGIVLTPFVPATLSHLADRLNIRQRLASLSWHFDAAVSAILAITVGLYAWNGFHTYRTHNYQILVEPTVYPTYAVQFMKSNEINGNILVPFDWGEYLIWHRPDSKVSIDGRFRTVYPENVIRKNELFAAGKSGWRDLLDDFPTDIVLVRNMDPVRNRMERVDDWVQIYRDPIASLFIPKTDPPGLLLKKHYDGRLIIDQPPPSTEFP